MQYLWQGVLGQLYLGKSFSSIGHVVAGSSTYCYLDRGGNKKKIRWCHKLENTVLCINNHNMLKVTFSTMSGASFESLMP